MKKKIFAVITAVMISVLFAVPAIIVSAAPAETTAPAADSAAVTANPASTEDTAKTTNDLQNERGGVMSIGGVIAVGVLVIIINTVISFAVANRFYKLTKKDSHIQSEIRALRRDIDDKFSGSIKEVKEKDVRVKNSNPDRSGGNVIKAPKPQKSAEEIAEDDKEIAEFAKRWNIEIESDDEPQVKSPINERSYSPERKTNPKKSVENNEEKDDNDGDVKIRKKKFAAKNKAKKFMDEIFPFDEDN